MEGNNKQRAGPRHFSVVIGPRGPTRGVHSHTPDFSRTEKSPTVVLGGPSSHPPNRASSQVVAQRYDDHEQEKRERLERYLEHWLRRPPFWMRTAAWMVMWLLVLQPVYVAYGTELEPLPEPEQAPVEAALEEVLPDEEVAESSADSEEEPEVVEVVESKTELDTEVLEEIVAEVNGDEEESASESDVEELDTGELVDDVEGGGVTSNETQATTSPDAASGSQETDTTGGGAVQGTTTDSGTSGTQTSVGGGTSSASTTPVATGTTSPVVDDGNEASGGGGSGGGEDSEQNDETDSSAEDESQGAVDTATSTIDTTPDDSASSTDAMQQPATTTPTTTEPTVADNGMLTFGEQECMVLQDGAFYCSKTGEEPTSDSMAVGSVVARKDATGDTEIYLVENGRTTQLTFNDYDDTKPVYDDSTLRVVWQAMINDRQQVMLHDRTTGKTTQLTNTSYNNSDPHVFGDILVWQAWIENNWEVIMATDLHREQPTIQQLTDNTAHDMFPKVFDNLVTWQAQTRDSWHVVVYDTKNKHYSYVKKKGDGRYENPRFVLVFDNRNEDGNVEVVGYDVATDQEVPLAPLPRKNPEPVTPIDDTGEALPASAATSSLATKNDRKDSGGDDE